jgi:hypothetical protein
MDQRSAADQCMYCELIKHVALVHAPFALFHYENVDHSNGILYVVLV